MNKKIILTTLFFILLSISLNPLLTYANFNKTQNSYSQSIVTSSNTIWVPDNYTTIQEAINNADEEETVFVRAGTYYEHVVVDKALSLIGENKRNTTIDGNGTGTVVSIIANNIILSDFTVQNGELGIWLGHSDNNVLSGNNALNNQYGIYLWGSDNNTFSGNNASGNTYGIYFSGSDNNVLSGNNALNNQYGIYLSFSSNSILSGNIASNNLDGIHFDGSGYNALTGNTVFSNNDDGIFLYYSRHNILTGNTATKNSRYGIRLSSSSNNAIFHNNFINNTEPLSGTHSVDSWDNGVEGNYWSDYYGTDANWDGIGDTPYSIDINNKDNYPLMAIFQQFKITTKSRSYNIYAVCDSIISNFQYARAQAVSFKLNGTEGEGFCRITIPHALIEPPHTTTVDHNPPAYLKTVQTNETHTWLYFTYDPTEHEVTIAHTFSIEQLVLSHWTIIGLTIIIAVLLLISIRYYRMYTKQKKVIQAYERELGSFPVTHPERARARFIKDVIERKEKIETFKKKYGIKIQPASTFEDLMNKMGVEKEKNRVKH